MAETIITTYTADTEGFKAQLRELEARFLATENSAKANVRKLNEALKEQQEILKIEVQNLKDLEKQAKNSTGAIKNGLNKQIAEAKFNIVELNNAISGTKTELDKGKIAAHQMGKEIKETEKEGKEFQNQILQIAAAVGIAFSVDAVIAFGKEAIELAAKAEGIKTAFAKISDESGLEKLRIATRGAVSDVELMSVALRADNFGIGPELLAKGLEFAGKRARQTGQDVEKLTESFVQGIGTQSARVLDNLGISQKSLRDEIKKTGDFNTAVSNLITKQTQQMGDVSLTTADKIAKIGVVYENLKLVAGETLIKIGEGYGLLFDKIVGVFSKEQELENIRKDIAAKRTGAIQFYTERYAKASKDQLLITLNDNKAGLLEQRRYQIELIEEAKKAGDKTLLNKRNSIVATTQIEINAVKNRLNDIQLEEESKADALAELNDKKAKEADEAFKKEKEIIKARNKAVFDQAIYEFDSIKKANKEIIDLEEAGLKEIEDNIKEQGSRSANDLKERLSKEQAIKDAANLRTILSTKAGTKERIDAEISLLDKANEEARVKIFDNEDDRFNIIAANEEKIASLKKDKAQKQIDTAIAISNTLLQLADLAVQADRNATTEQIANIDEQTQKELDNNQSLLDAKAISQAEFEAKKKDIELKAAAQKKVLLTKQAQEEKDLAIFGAIIKGAEAVIANLGNPVLAILAGVTAAAELALIVSTPIPKFAKGTPFVEQGRNASGIDKIPAMLNKGERVVTAEENKNNWDIYEHLRLGSFNKNFKSTQQVSKILANQKREFEKAQNASFADNIAASILLNQKGFNDGNIVEGLKMLRKNDRENAQYIVNGIIKGTSRKSYR